ncbi:hypothetical protein [Deinococcus planocerae]|uniref:hypothetical protein n=1 Tax=Deinococcus planocerae TaxID=1737569 RepID=UPI0015E14076|nr:hypothetical protein [Deinococcus planocerae]
MIATLTDMREVEPIAMVDQNELEFDQLQEINVASVEAQAGVAAFVVGFAVAVLVCTS